MTKTEKIAKAIAGILNEIANATTADATPSFYDIDDIVWFDIDKSQPDSIILSDADRNDNRRPRFRVTVTKI